MARAPAPSRVASWSRALESWIGNAYPTSADALGVGRVLFAGSLLFAIGLPDRLWLDALPAFVFDPRPGPGSLFGAFPPAWFFQGLRWLSCTLGLAVLLGYRTRAASIGLGLALVLTYSFEGRLASGGPVFLMTFPLVMSCSNWGAALSIDALRNPGAERRVSVWPIAYLSLLLGFLMWTAGVSKLATGWLEPSLATRGHLLRTHLDYGRDALLAPWMLAHAPVWLWQLADLATVLLEVGFLLAVPWPRVFRLFCAGALFFHTGILLVMNIDYSVHAPLYAVFFLGSLDSKPALQAGVARWQARLAVLYRPHWRLPGAGWGPLACAGGLWCLLVRPGGSPTSLLLEALGLPPTPHRGLLLLVPGCALALLYLGGRLRSKRAPQATHGVNMPA